MRYARLQLPLSGERRQRLNVRSRQRGVACQPPYHADALSLDKEIVALDVVGTQPGSRDQEPPAPCRHERLLGDFVPMG